jgi:hypothetical protein
MDYKSKLLDSLLTPGLTGVYTGLGAYFILDETGVVNFPIVNILPGSVALALIGFGTSFIGNNLGVWVFDKIPDNSYKSANLERQLIVPVMTGVSMTAAYKLINPDFILKEYWMKPFLLGGVSESLSQNTVNMIKPYVVSK